MSPGHQPPQIQSPASLDAPSGPSGVTPIHSASTLAPILEQILASKRQRLESVRKLAPEKELRQRAAKRTRRNFAAALRRDAKGVPAVIAELKRASPSKGLLRKNFDVSNLAASYQVGGAAALSVLTEEDHFLGSPEYLELAHRATALPILRKDFIFDPYQLWEAAAWGADAVLLIAAILGKAQMAELLAIADQAQLAALVEVHDPAELRTAVAAGARTIGVNNRDLRDFSVDVDLSLRMSPLVPEGVVRVAESGVKTPADLVRLGAAGYDAVLVGEHFMLAAQPGEALANLLRGTRDASKGA